jgi:hypothetical protein
VLHIHEAEHVPRLSCMLHPHYTALPLHYAAYLDILSCIVWCCQDLRLHSADSKMAAKCKDMEGNSHGLAKVLFQHLPGREDWGKPPNFQSG